MTENKKNKNREKLLGALTALVLGGAFIFSIIIDPRLKERQRLIEILQEQQIDLAKMKGDLLVKDRIEKIYSQIEPVITSTGTEQQEISSFVRELNGIYGKLNIKTRSVKILPSTKEPFYRRLTIRIEMEGHIGEFLKFFEIVEKHQSPIRIEQLELNTLELRDNIRASFLVSKIISEPKAENEKYAEKIP